MGNYAGYDPTPQAPPRSVGRTARRARTRAIFALAIAVFSGLVATWLMGRALSRRGSPPPLPMKKVVVARAELPITAALTPEMLEVIDWPAGSVPAGTFDDPKALSGRVLRAPMVAGEPFLAARLDRGADGLAAAIPSGLRAMTVRVNEASGVSGFVHPGDLVDVVATMPPRPDSTELRSRVVLQGLRVLAIGDELEARGVTPIKVPVVTLLVLPAQAERLALASASHGELSLTMRGAVDLAEVETPGVSPPDLFGLFGRPAEARSSSSRTSQGDGAGKRSESGRKHDSDEPSPPPARHAEGDDVVEIIRGSSSEQRKLRSTGGEP